MDQELVNGEGPCFTMDNTSHGELGCTPEDNFDGQPHHVVPSSSRRDSCSSVTSNSSGKVVSWSEVPDSIGEEVVLNRRGTQVRTRKPNQAYYDSSFLTDPLTRGSRKARAPKHEPEAQAVNGDLKKHSAQKLNGAVDATDNPCCGKTIYTNDDPLPLDQLKKVKRIPKPPPFCTRGPYPSLFPFSEEPDEEEEDIFQNKDLQQHLMEYDLSDISGGGNQTLQLSAVVENGSLAGPNAEEEGVKVTTTDIMETSSSNEPTLKLVTSASTAAKRSRSRSVATNNAKTLTSKKRLDQVAFKPSPLPSMPDLTSPDFTMSDLEAKSEPVTPHDVPDEQFLPALPALTEAKRSGRPKIRASRYPSNRNKATPYSRAVTAPVEKQLTNAHQLVIDGKKQPNVSKGYQHVVKRKYETSGEPSEDEGSYQSCEEITARKEAEDVAVKLRNILKLPKAHRWIYYEWFYSDMDRALLENDFESCLQECFPNLKARKMTRTELNIIRRLMGKPRRCSQSFFDQERELLAHRRKKLRVVQQQRLMPENWTNKDLPDEIPRLLTIGTKVNARLRLKTHNGFYSGTVEGVDTSNNTYRITFDRHGLGTHSIADYEVAANVPPDTISVASFSLKVVRAGSGARSSKFKFQNLSLLEKLPEGIPKSVFSADVVLGGFPIRFLELIVRFSRLLRIKRDKNLEFRELNVEAEKFKAYGKPYPKDFQLRYAKFILELESINQMIQKFVDVLQMYCKEVSSDSYLDTKMLDPEEVLQTANKDASAIVSTYNRYGSGNSAPSAHVHSPKILSLVEQMASLMLQVKAVAAETGERKSHELKSLRLTMAKMKESLAGGNVKIFEDKIELPMKRIMAGLCQD